MTRFEGTPDTCRSIAVLKADALTTALTRRYEHDPDLEHTLAQIIDLLGVAIMAVDDWHPEEDE